MFKKILASALAVAMLAGVSVTAFADNMATESDLLINDGDLFLMSSLYFMSPDERWYLLNDEGQMVTNEWGYPETADISQINPGDKIATPILKFELPEDFDFDHFDAGTLEESWFYLHYAEDARPTKDDVKGWKVDADWQFEEAEDLIEEIRIEAVQAPNDMYMRVDHVFEPGANYFVTIEFKDDVAEIDHNDLVGKLTLYKRNKSNASEDLQVLQMNGNHFATVGYESIGYDEAGFHDITSTGAPVRDFTDANMNEITELYFDGVGAFYTANIGDEGEKYLGFNMNPDYELLAQYPDADMEFINFPGMVKFNRFGTFELFKQENQFAYAVVDGEIVTLESIARNGRVVDGIDEGYSLVLSIKDFPESFILSDTELELTEAEDEEVVEAVDAEPAA